MEWQPLKGRIKDPNKREVYVSTVDKLIQKVDTTSVLRNEAKQGSPSVSDERSYLEDLVFSRILAIAQAEVAKAKKARKGDPQKDGFQAIISAYPGIEQDLAEIFSNHRDTRLGRKIYEYADVLVRPHFLGKYTKSDLVNLQQQMNATPEGAAPPNVPIADGGTETARDINQKEKDYIQTTESPGIPRDLRVQWRTKGVPRSNQNWKRIQGPDLALQYKEIEIVDPEDPSKKVKVNLNILIDEHGRLRTDMLFPTSRNPYIQARAKKLREAFAETFAQNQIFGDTYMLSKKISGWMDLERYTPGRYRSRIDHDKQGETGIERLYGTEEGKVRREQIAKDLAKKEFAALMNERIMKYFKGKPRTNYTGKEVAKAVGIDYQKCFDPTDKKFSGYRAFLLFHGIDPDDPSPSVASQRKALIKKITDTYYIGYGFREFRFPVKDEVGAAQPGTQMGMLEYNDTGFTPDQEAAEAFTKDMLDLIGKKMFTGNSYTLGLGIKAETIQGPEGVRVKVQYPDGRILYYDPDNYWDVQARTMAAGEAAVMHQQIQALARDPINFSVAWYYQGVGNAMVNMVPGARSAYNSTLRILKQRNSLLPKMDQLSTKALKEWSNLIVKRTILAPMYVYDPDTNRATPRIAYSIRKGLSFGLDWLVGSELQPGALDKLFIKSGAKEWYWDPITKTTKKRAWEPRIFKSLIRTKREKERYSIFDLALRMGTGIFFNMIAARTLNLVARVPQVAKAIHNIQGLKNLPMRAFNAGFSRLPLDGFLESLTTNAPPAELLNKKFLGKNVYTSTQVSPAGGGIWKVSLGTGFRANLYRAIGKLFSQNGLTRAGNYLKLGWQGGSTLLKTAGQAIVPAAMAGIVFNSPIAFVAAAVTSGVPLGMMNLASLADSNAFFTTTRVGENFDTLAKILYKPHAEAATVLNPINGTFTEGSLPKLFGLERFLFDELTVYDKATFTESKVFVRRNNWLSKFLTNHANVRGLLKGLNRATFAFSIAYALTGSYVWAAVAAGSAVALSITAENITSILSQKVPEIAGKLTGVSQVASSVGSVAMGGVTLAVGLNFVREGIKAMVQGGEEWEEWKNQNFGNAISTSFSLMTVFGIAGSISSIMSASGAIGTYLMKPAVSVISRFGFLQGARAWSAQIFGTWGVVGGITGFIIGAILGGMFGAQIGGMIGGTIGGIFGGIVGGMLLGTVVLPIIGSIIGGIVGGIAGAFAGIGLEKLIKPRVDNFLKGFRNAFNIIGNALNILQAVKMLLSGDLGDVGVGALMLCLAGIFTFSTLTSNAMTAASHVETEWTESITPEAGMEVLPAQITGLSKNFSGFSNDGKTIEFDISFTNLDEQDRDITFKIIDTLGLENNENVSSVPTSTASEDSLVIETAEETLPANSEKSLHITFTHPTESFEGDSGLIDQQGNKRLCNTVKVDGKVGEESFNGQFVLCIDKNGERVGSGGGPVYTGSMQEIFEQVKAEFNDGTCSYIRNATLQIISNCESCACHAFDKPTLKCENLSGWSDEKLTGLFRHELTHFRQSCSSPQTGDVNLREWGAEHNSGNGGWYCFLVNGQWMLGTEITEYLLSIGCPMDLIDKASLDNANAERQLMQTCGTSPKGSILIKKRRIGGWQSCN